jgi:hypothetical protein
VPLCSSGALFGPANLSPLVIRGSICSPSEHSGSYTRVMACVWGIDWLSLSVPTVAHCEKVPRASEVLSAGPWDGLQLVRTKADVERQVLYIKALEVGKGDVNVRLSRLFTPYAVWWLLLNWNPSRQLYGSTGELARLEDLPGLLAEVYGALRDVVTVSDWNLASLTRIDATVDFRGQAPAVERPGSIRVDRGPEVEDHPASSPQAGPPGGVDGVVPALLQRFAGTADRVIPASGRPVETCYWNSPGSQAVKAYNKGIQRGEDGVDWLRTEVVCRKLWLRKAGIKAIGTLNGRSLDRCARAPWEATKMGEMRELDKVVALSAALVEMGLSGQSRRSFVGWLYEVEHGLPEAREGARATLAKYRQWKRRLGPLGEGVWSDYDRARYGPPLMARLDLDSGSIVVERAS